ncbi:MAG: hypothetical protein R3D05_14940 [Dongiaceae bacterium]
MFKDTTGNPLSKMSVTSRGDVAVGWLICSFPPVATAQPTHRPKKNAPDLASGAHGFSVWVPLPVQAPFSYDDDGDCHGCGSQRFRLAR